MADGHGNSERRMRMQNVENGKPFGAGAPRFLHSAFAFCVLSFYGRHHDRSRLTRFLHSEFGIRHSDLLSFPGPTSPSIRIPPLCPSPSPTESSTPWSASPSS